MEGKSDERAKSKDSGNERACLFLSSFELASARNGERLGGLRSDTTLFLVVDICTHLTYLIRSIWEADD
jgi:hypothetical protein